MSKLPLVVLNGNPGERGYAHGQQLKERIHRTFDFYYESIFLNSVLDGEEIRSRADQVKSLIAGYAPGYIEEIEAIAEGADMESWKIYVLNARTEILNAPVAECTSLYFEQTALLGQTWDWIRQLEDLVVILHYEFDDGHVITTMSEPGMLAKIGMNSSGLGVCLNFLLSENQLDGVPVHIVLRAILECNDIEEARQRIMESGKGKSSHFLVADALGNCFSMEYANGERGELKAEQGALVHTNHCIAPEMNSTLIPTTLERLEQAGNHLQSIRSHEIKDMMDILLDDSRGNDSIQACYHPEDDLGGLEVGTCATIIMDLAKKCLYCKKGPGPSRDFHPVSL